MNLENNLHMGEKIKQFRKKKRLNLKEFGQALGYSYVHVSNIERGTLKPSREFLIKLKEVFGISSDYILFGEPPGEAAPDLVVPVEKAYEGGIKVGTVHEPEIKFPIFPTATKKLIDNLVEILESSNSIAIDVLKSSIRGALEIVHISKNDDEDKSKGGD